MTILAHSAEHVPGLSHWFGMYHFLFLHFPIAATLLAAVSEFLNICRKNPNFAFTARFLLWMAFLSAIPTAASGLMLAEEHRIQFGDTLWMHRFFGIGTLILSGISAALSSTQRRKLYLCFLLILVVFVFITGDLGGDMSYPGFQWIPGSENTSS